MCNLKLTSFIKKQPTIVSKQIKDEKTMLGKVAQ